MLAKLPTQPKGETFSPDLGGDNTGSSCWVTADYGAPRRAQGPAAITARPPAVHMVRSAGSAEDPDPYHFPGSGSVKSKVWLDPYPIIRIRIQQKPLNTEINTQTKFFEDLICTIIYRKEMVQ